MEVARPLAPHNLSMNRNVELDVSEALREKAKVRRRLIRNARTKRLQLPLIFLASVRLLTPLPSPYEFPLLSTSYLSVIQQGNLGLYRLMVQDITNGARLTAWLTYVGVEHIR